MAERNTIAAFWDCVDRSGDCWVWKRPVHARSRYPKFRIGNRTRVKAHRFAWELANGLIPHGLHVLHRCDNTICVRPDHLFLGTHDDNMADKAAKGRVVAPKGEACHLARISAEQAAAIREAYASGISQSTVAARFGIDQTHVSRIVRGKAWAHVGGPTCNRHNSGRKPAESAST